MTGRILAVAAGLILALAAVIGWRTTTRPKSVPKLSALDSTAAGFILEPALALNRQEARP